MNLEIRICKFDQKLLEDKLPQKRLVHLAHEIEAQKQGHTNHCAKYAVLHALSYWQPKNYDKNGYQRNKIFTQMKCTIPNWIPKSFGGGATLPNNIVKYLLQNGFNDKLQKKTNIENLKRYIYAGAPCIVALSSNSNIFRPHYKLAVGFCRYQR